MTTAAQNMRVLLRKSPLCRKHFFEWLKTTVLLFDCGTSTLKSPLLRAFFTPHVHSRLRKCLSRCTLDCGFKTPESPALRGFVAERCPITGTSLYLAFFFVLEKGSKSAGNAVIPTFPMHRSYGLQHLRHKRRNVRFKGLRWVHTPPQPLTAHTAAYTPKQGRFERGGITTRGAFCAVRKPCVAGYQNGKPCRFWGLVGGTLKERREPAEQRCAYACRCSEASRLRWAA